MIVYENMAIIKCDCLQKDDVKHNFVQDVNIKYVHVSCDQVKTIFYGCIVTRQHSLHISFMIFVIGLFLLLYKPHTHIPCYVKYRTIHCAALTQAALRI